MKFPTDREVYARLLVLKHVIAHALCSPPRDMLQEITENWPQQEKARFDHTAQQESETMLSSMKHLGILSAISPKEMTFLQSNMATMEAYEQIAASWRIEGAYMLMWALQYVDEFPPIDETIDHDVLKHIPVQRIETLPPGTLLREREDILYARDIMELWHWRSRTRYLIQAGEQLDPTPEMEAQGLFTFDDIVRMTARNHYDSENLAEILDDDFVVNGVPFRVLSDDDWSHVNSIIAERHYALNWLCGYAPENRWDDTPTET